MRWPFGPPHLTLKPSTKNNKNTKTGKRQLLLSSFQLDLAQLELTTNLWLKLLSLSSKREFATAA